MRTRRGVTALIAAAGLAGLAAWGTNAAADKAVGTSAGGKEEISIKVSSLGGKNVLTDGAGRALYMFAKDKPNTSNCTGECLAVWPALSGPAKAGDKVDPAKLGTAGKQATYAGRPLYYFAKDKKPGDTLGQGVKGVWFLLDAKGNPNGNGTVAARKIAGQRVLTDGAGLTLYEFQKDKPNKSNCLDKICKANWPVLNGPAVAAPGIDAAKLGTITRPDGVKQATYAGKPLYYHVRDKKPGDIRGRGFKGVWCLVNVKN